MVNLRASTSARRLAALVAACALAGAWAGASHAALGEPDPQYGKGGLAVAGTGFAPTDAHLDGAGRAVFGGQEPVPAPTPSGMQRGRLVRLDAAGSGDPAWGEGGSATIDSAMASFAFAPAPRGEWVVAAVDYSSQLVITRLSADGDPVGEPVTVGGGYATVGDLEVLDDGRVVLAGRTQSSEFQEMYVARLTATYQRERPDTVSGSGEARAVAVDALGRTLVAGVDEAGGFVMRFQPELTTDTGFANGGTRRVGSALDDVEVLGDGGILLAGSDGDGALLARLTHEGAPDTGFGGTYRPGGRSASFADLVVDAVGGIYAAGLAGGGRLLVYRFDDRGRPDPTLRPEGFREIDAGAAAALAGGLDAQERPHVLGATADGAAAARLLANAAPSAAIAGPASVPLGARAILDASGSSDPEGALRRFEWDLDGDGGFETDSGANPGAAHTFTVAGTRTVAVRVTDHRGLQATAARHVQVEPPPPGAPVPVLGRAFVAQPLRGTVRVRRPGESRYTTLQAGEQIPEGTIVDARRGRIRITVARDASGATDSADFYLGRFRISQTNGAAPYTTLSLYGGSFRGCGSARPKLRVPLAETAAASKRRKRRVVRRLWGDGSGRFRTKGRYASATVRGTKWQTIDRCDGVKLRVVRGVVDFRDLLRATRSRRVRAGGTDFVPSKRKP